MQFGGQTLPQIIDDIANRIVELYRKLPFACFDSLYSTSQNGAKSPGRAFGAFIKRIHLQIKFTIFKMLSISLQLHFNE